MEFEMQFCSPSPACEVIMHIRCAEQTRADRARSLAIVAEKLIMNVSDFIYVRQISE
jgi:hypothetical protein